MMITVTDACLVLITVELALITVFLVVTLLKIRQTAQAVEVLAYRVDHEVEHIGETMRSGWVKSLQAAASVIGGLWGGGRRRQHDD